MGKKIVAVVLAVCFVVGLGIFSAQAADADYQTKLDSLNQQINQARVDYKKQMSDTDDAMVKKMQALGPKDKVGRKACLDQKRTQKRQIQEAYKKQQAGLRAQVKTLKDANRHVTETQSLKSKKK